jgi:Ala-tRNA(Pro) deacylase
MPIRSLNQFLNENHVRYTCYNHKPTFTAQETAEVLHVSGHELVKTVLLIVDGRMVMAVLPACERIDFNLFKQQAGAKHVDLAAEQDIVNLAPLCDRGSLPPIGNLYGMEVFVSTTVVADEVICFCGGTHTEDIRMSYDDWEHLVQPRIMSFTYMH